MVETAASPIVESSGRATGERIAKRYRRRNFGELALAWTVEGGYPYVEALQSRRHEGKLLRSLRSSQ
jgi:hypothetical protein